MIKLPPKSHHKVSRDNKCWNAIDAAATVIESKSLYSTNTNTTLVTLNGTVKYCMIKLRDFIKILKFKQTAFYGSMNISAEIVVMRMLSA